MKKLIFAVLAISVILVSCRKKDLREVPTLETIGAVHCLNGVLDSNEVGLDCGGPDCGPCTQTTVPCALNSDEIYYLESPSYATKSFINTSSSVSVNGFYSYKGYTADGDSLSILFSEKPDVTQIYGGVYNTFDLESGTVYMQYYQPFPQNDYKVVGNVYINYSNGSYTISCCDFTLTVVGQTQSLTTNTLYFSITI
jgi:hypothetical protein